MCFFIGSWRKIATDQCIGAKGNHYKQFTYTGPNTFIIAMKLVHIKGSIGCDGSQYTKWGCKDSTYPMNIIVTGVWKNLLLIYSKRRTFGKILWKNNMHPPYYYNTHFCLILRLFHVSSQNSRPVNVRFT